MERDEWKRPKKCVSKIILHALEMGNGKEKKEKWYPMRQLRGRLRVKTIGREKRQKLRNDILLAKCKSPTGPILIKPITEFYAHAYLTSD